MNFKFKTLFHICSYKNSPILIHVTMPLVFLYFLSVSKLDWYYSIVTTICLIVIFALHELGHAFWVKYFNHYLIDIRIYPIHGECNYSCDSRYEPETLIFLGGVMAQALILFISLSIISALRYSFPYILDYYLEPFFNAFVKLNLTMIFINLLPIPGLDGYMVWQRFIEFSKDYFTKKAMSKMKKAHNDHEKIVDIAIKRAQKNSRDT